MWATDAITRDLLVNLAAGLVSGAVIFIIGLRWRLISSFLSRDRAKFRRLFGAGAIETGCVTVTLDTYQDLRLLPQVQQSLHSTQSHGVSGYSGYSGTPGNQRFYKVFPDGHFTAFPGAFEDVMGYCTARAAAYLIDGLSGIGNGNVRVISDSEAAAFWEGTFINLGSSATNIKTNDIKKLPENPWLLEDINKKFEFKDGRTEEIDSNGDKGIILKIQNPFFKNHSLFVCAGLGEWGTSGAAWYLAKNWWWISVRFKKEPFLIVINVSPKSDESAREIIYFGKECTSARVYRKIKKIIKI